MPITSPRCRHERAAGVAGIERRIGLQDVVHQSARPRPERSAKRADHAGRHRMLEPVRVADGDRDLPHADQSRIAQRRPRQRFSLGRHDADDRQIGVGIGADTIRQHRSTIRHHHRDAPGPLDHVIVGENQSVGREADARTAAFLDVDLDDGRPDRLDGANHRLRIRVEQFAVVNRFWLEAHDPILRTGPSSHTTQTGGTVSGLGCSVLGCRVLGARG